MTTSDPRAEHPDDNPREHRGLGQRILDAVLGDPADSRRDDPAGTGRDPADEARRDAGPAGFVDRDEARRDAGYDARDATADARRDTGAGGIADDARRDAGQGGFVDRGEAGRDAGYDPRRDTDRAGPGDQRSAQGTTAAPWDSGYDHPRADAERADVVHDLPRTDAAPAGTGAGPDFVTSSYDPDRDRGYDPQAAGTAVADRTETGGRTDRDVDPDRDRGYDPQAAGTAVGPSDGPVARNTRPDARDTDRDDSRAGSAGDYDPTQDTGYVDPARAEADRTTVRRDDDYDTGRVDADRTDAPRHQGGRAASEPDRTDTRGGAGTAAAGAVGTVAAGVAAAALGRSDRDRSDTDRDTGFSKVDDTATVDPTDTGRSTPDTQPGPADENALARNRERLVPADRANEYSRRWDALKGDFVDEPRRAVRQADELVGEVLDELQRLFADQRRGLEQSFDSDRASTEDLRLALRRYRSFFDRLLSF